MIKNSQFLIFLKIVCINIQRALCLYIYTVGDNNIGATKMLNVFFCFINKCDETGRYDF